MNKLIEYLPLIILISLLGAILIPFVPFLFPFAVIGAVVGWFYDEKPKDKQ